MEAIMKGLVGEKVGMTQIFTEDGRRIPVTVVDVSSNVVVQKKSSLGKEKYSAVKLGFKDAHKFEKEGEETQWRLNKPRLGVFLKAGVTPKQHLVEIRLSADAELDRYEVGQELKATEFSVGSYVDVSGRSKGHGFTGVMKRHNFSGCSTMTHGTHENFRHGGSIGASAWPARVFKGQKMPGHDGNTRTTVQNLKIVEIIEDENLILIKGGIPGPNGAIVVLRQASKRANSIDPV
jgi:large subunit ribosomal protein L3